MFSASIRLDCTTSDALDSIISVASWLSVPTIPVSLFIPIGSRIGHRRARALEQRDASPASIFYLSELVDRDLCLDERRGVVVCGKRFAFAWKALTLSLRSTARSTSILAVTKVMGCVSRHGHPPLPRTRRDMAPAYHHHSIGVLMYLIASTLQVFTLRTGSVGGSTCLARTRKVHSLNLSKCGGYFNSHLPLLQTAEKTGRTSAETLTSSIQSEGDVRIDRQCNRFDRIASRALEAGTRSHDRRCRRRLPRR